MLYEAFLLFKGTDDADTQERLVEVRINRGATDRFEALQLTGCGDVEALQKGAQSRGHGTKEPGATPETRESVI